MVEKKRKKPKKLNGEYFLTRGSNHEYDQLNDLDELLELLKVHCPADVAKIKAVPYNSLRHIIVTYYSEEQQSMIAWKRRRHKNKLETK